MKFTSPNQMNQKTFRIIKKQGIHHKQLDGYQHALFYRGLNVVLSILGACNLGLKKCIQMCGRKI